MMGRQLRGTQLDLAPDARRPDQSRGAVLAEQLTPRTSATVVALLLAGALIAWIVTVERMRGMDTGPGTDLGAVGWYLGIWTTMMAAMMLPSAAPAVQLFSRARGGGQTVAFVAGYLLSWTAYGLIAYGVYRAICAEAPSFLAWGEQGPRGPAGGPRGGGVFCVDP